jgi:hypothetical protein
MKVIFTIFCLFNFIIHSSGQYKYDYNYVCGYGSRSGQADPILNFNGDTLQIKHEHLKIGLDRCNSTMSDSSGKLLYYFNGCDLANIDHEIVENGANFNAGVEANYICPENLGYLSGQQSALSLPVPGYGNRFIIFHDKQRIYSIGDSITYYYDANYSIVDMALNGGKGKVIQKNISVLQDTTTGAGNFVAIKHINNQDWWVIKRDNVFSNNYYKILVKKDSVIEYSSQYIGLNFERRSQGGCQASFSPNGHKYMSFSSDEGLFIMDFDRQTAIFSNFIHVPVVKDGLFSGASFSPNSRFIYLSDRLYLYQVDLMDEKPKAELIAEWDGFREPFLNRGTVFGPMQIGPDCRIYVSTGSCIKYWHIIMNPDEKGVACDVKQHALEFNTSICNIPYFPNYRLDTGYAFCDPDKKVITGSLDIFWPDQKDKFIINIYPNPSSDYITIETSQPCKIEIYDITGHKVLTTTTDENRTEVNIAPLNPGLYLIKCTTGSGVASVQKFVKQ